MTNEEKAREIVTMSRCGPIMPVSNVAPVEVDVLEERITTALSEKEAETREADAQIAETEAAKRCMGHQQSGRGICGYEIAAAIRAAAGG